MKKRKLTIVLALILIILVMLIIIYNFFLRNVKEDKSSKTIIATKTINQGNEEENIIYRIQITNYNVLNIQKEITFESKEKAQAEYERYNLINTYEVKEMVIELNNKKVMLVLPERAFIEDIEYDETKNITLIKENGEETEILSQKEIINCLQQQGYSIKK